jgi:uncharacterized repeat protein (TIGR01451 family)
MLKSIAFSLLLLLACATTQAQFVTIPDANFVTYLQNNYPTCMSGNQLDTTCTSVTTVTLVNVENKGIADLSGIQYFDALLLLNCRTNQLTSLPPLPAGLWTLQADNNQLAALPTPLPPGLQILNAGGNQLTALPSLPSTLQTCYVGSNANLSSYPTFPAGLLELDIQSNSLAVLPALPAGLSLLYCANNPLGTLPTLPPSLVTLSALNCQLSNLPPLPNTLQFLSIDQNNFTTLAFAFPPALTDFYCSYNQLTTLPPLPATMVHLGCDHNLLTALPTLPSGMLQVECSNNQITSLPAIPSTLGMLIANNNLIVSVPALPSGMYVAQFNNNQVTCFAPFPQSNTLNLQASNNPFTCIPNYPNYMTPLIGSIPICTPGNVFGCTNGEGLGGTVYDDTNSDCVLNGLDPGIQNVPIQIFDNTGALVQVGSSYASGAYFFSQPVGSWTAKIDTAGKPFRVACSYPGLDTTVVLSVSTPLAQGINFEVDCKPGFDVGVNGVAVNGMLFPGQPFAGKALAGDLSNFYGLHCATGVAGQVVVNFSGPATYTAPSLGALTPTVAGNTFTYNIADFGTVNAQSDFGLEFSMATTATIGDTVCFDVVVTPSLGDQNPTNNIYSLCLPVRNSLDPNAKDVSPSTVGAMYHDWLNYTVHFQNTGTAAAINIHVEDTLDANLDWASMEMLGASHYQTWTLVGNALDVRFPNILLADSASDPLGSQGWFMYRIKPKANLPLGTVIPNSAAIYFDFNAPVITNTATTNYNLVTGIRDQVNAAGIISVYPNPSTGRFQVEYPANWKHAEWTVSNLMGQTLRHDSATGGAFAVDLSGQPAGFYLLKLSDGKQEFVRHLVKD